MVSARRKFITCSVLAAWSVLLTAMTGVLGGIPLRGLRLAAGGWAYWVIGLSCSMAMAASGRWFWAGLFLALVTVIGFFTELEERGYSLSTSGFFSVICTSLGLAGAFVMWASYHGPSWQGIITNLIENYLSSIPGWSQKIQIEAKDVIAQIPSLVVVALMLGLFLALLFQRRVLAMAGFRRGPAVHLSKFAVPDAFIWIFLAGVAGTFLGGKNSWVMAAGINLLNVSAVVFFLQGLAVVTSVLRMLRTGWLWQTLLLVVLVTQLFILVSAIGLVDYWMDFRQRLEKRRQELEREILKK